ncbi:unnamed protein product [Calicophoron daubneyi]|uniref:FHA domain-containing protein n=1 Tax=Calicophoron daubneyi TaxID=300641 RepID=A0AAV2TPJ9_CALDB
MPISGYIGVIKQDGSESTLCDWSSRNCTIGRDPGCDISINLETVAPIHCSLELMDNGLVQATSHIPGEYVMLVNGVPMTGSFILPDNCLLTVGERHFRFFYPSSRNTLRVGIRPKDFTEVASPSVTSDPRKSVGRTNATGLLTPQNMPEVQPSRTKTTPRRLMSPARSPHPLRPATPKSALGTRERYGPVPPRPVATPPAVQVLRHTPKPVSPPRSATHVNKSPSIRGPGTPARILTDLSNPAVLTLTPKEVDSRHNMKSPRTPAVAKKDFSPGGLLSPLNQSELGQTNAQSALKAIGPRKLVIKSPVPRQTPRIGSTDRKQRPPTPYPSSAKVSPSPVSKNNTEKLGSPRRNAVGHVQRDGEIIKTLPAKTDRTPSDASKVRNLVGLVHPASAYIDRKAMKRPAPRRISMVTEDIQIASAKRLKGVSFGPALSPEQFDKALPPSTPVKKGAIPPVKVSTPRQTLRSASLVSNTPDPLSTATELSHTYHSFGSPSYQATTPGRVSAVVSIPPTPDENLLDSQSGIAETNLNSNPCYSAPVSRNLLQNKSRPVEHKRYSVGPSATSLNSRRPQTPQAPPSTPVSEGRRNRSQQTPQILGKSSEVSSTHKEHTQHTLENQTSQTKTKVGSNNAQATPSFSSPTMQPTSTPSSVITPLAARKSPKNNSKTAVSPRVSGVADMFASDVETGGVRSGRRSQSSPRRSVSGRRSVRTPSSVRKSVGKTPRLTGVRRLMKTPKTAVSPRVSDVGEMFVSDVETGGVRSGRRSQSSPRRSVSGRRSVRTPSSVRKSVGKTPRLTGVRRLMKTPKTAVSPRVSGVADMFASDVETGGVRSGRRSQSSPRRSVSGRRSVRTPSSVRKSVGKTPRLTGVRKLMKTPKTAVSPRVSGLAEMFADLSVGIGDMVSQSGDVAENVRSSAVLKKVRSRKAGGLGRRERLARNVRDISPSDKSVVGGADSPKPVGLVSNALRGRKRVLAAKAESVERSTAGKRKKNFEVSREKQASRSPSTDLNGSRGTNAGGLHTLVPAGSGRKNPGKKDSVSESLPVSKPSVASRRLRGRNAVTRSETPTAGSIAVRMRGRRAANKLENNTITASSPLASLSAISPKKTLGSRAAAVKRARRAPVSPPGSSKSIFSRPESLTRKGKRSRTVTKIAKSESASSPRQPESHSPDLARVPQKRLRSKVIALSTTGTSASPSDSHKSRSPESKRLRSRDGAKVVSAASPSSGPRKSLSSEPSGVAPRKLRSRATVRKTRNVSTPASSPREPVTPEASAVSQKKSRSRTTTRNAVHTLSAPPNSEKSSPVKLEKEVKRKTPPVRSVRPGALPSKETADLTSNAISQSLRNKAARRKATPKRSSNGFKSANPTPSKQARSHRVTAGKVKARGKTGRALLSKTTNTPVTEPNHGTRAKQSTQQSPKPLSIPAVSPRRTRARTAKRP